MEDTKGSTKAKSKVVTSPTKASRQALNASQSTADGAKPPTDEREKEAEKIRDLLARVIDIYHNYPCRMKDGGMPKPHISTEFGFLFLAFPLGGHVIENAVTSEGAQNFLVDGGYVIPVTSEEK